MKPSLRLGAAFPKVRYWGSKIARLCSAFAGSDLARVKTKTRFCLHTALPWNVFCRDCIVWGAEFGGTSMEKIMLLCLIIGVIGVLAELWPVLPPLK